MTPAPRPRVRVCVRMYAKACLCCRVHVTGCVTADQSGREVLCFQAAMAHAGTGSAVPDFNNIRGSTARRWAELRVGASGAQCSRLWLCSGRHVVTCKHTQEHDRRRTRKNDKPFETFGLPCGCKSIGLPSCAASCACAAYGSGGRACSCAGERAVAREMHEIRPPA